MQVDAERHYYRLGSGYLVADGLVLTAAHVLKRADGTSAQQGDVAEVALTGETWQQGRVGWINVDLDVAVVDCRLHGQAPREMCAAGRIRWGKLAGSDPLDWDAVGYPAASRTDEEGDRQAEQVYGRTAPISERGAGRLALTVESRPPAGSGSPWSGMSGAAVFCGEYLVGVVTTDPGSWERSLEARRIEALADDDGLAELLGGTLVLEEVSGKPREPGLENLRSTLPTRNNSFTGREDELSALTPGPGSGTVLIQALVGLGGTGKSALAAEYANRRYEAHETDLAWWFVAEDRQVLLAAMASHYRHLTGTTGTTGTTEDAQVSAAALRNWLENCPYRWIVIFDNAEPGNLDGLLPACGGGQVILTSRASDWPGIDTQVIDVLPHQDAVNLLARIAKLPADSDADELADELGGLALALEQAGAYIRQTHSGYGDYLEALRADRGAVYSADLARLESITARVWRRSLDHVTAGQDDHPATVLGILSYLAPDNIPRQILAAAAIKGTPLLSDLGSFQVNVALARLADYSLIRLDENAITIHRLIQDLTRLDAKQTGRATGYAAAAISLLDQAEVPLALLLPHITMATAQAEELDAAPEQTVSVLNKACQVLLDAGQLQICRPLADRALRVAQRHLGADHIGTLGARGSLASLLGQAGRLQDTIRQFTALVADSTRILGPDHPDTLSVRGSLAYALGQAGRVQEATSELTQLLADCFRVLGPDHPITLRIRNSLASALGAAGKVQDAITQYKTLLADDTRVLGADHPDTLFTRGNLAYALGLAGRVQDAITQYTALLDDQTRILGPDNPATLGTRGNLANTLGQAGRVQDAITQYTALLDDQTRVLGPDHPSTLVTRGALVGLLGTAGRVQDAITQYTALLDDQTRVLGPDNPATLGTRGALAYALGLVGRVQDAITQYTALLDDQTRVLGPDNPATLGTRGALAYALGLAGRVQDAITQYTALLDDQTRVLGPDNPATLGTRGNLARLLGQAGLTQQAITEATQLIADCTRVMGADHPDTLGGRGIQVGLLGQDGKLQDAITEYTALLGDCTRVLGPDHPSTLSTRGNLANTLGQAGRVQEAITRYAGLVDDCTRVLGPDHPDTLVARGIQAGLLAQAGQLQDAIAQYTTLVDDCTRVLGPDHPSTLATRGALAGLLGTAGRVQDAITQYTALLDDQTRVLGPDNPATLGTRGALAYALGLRLPGPGRDHRVHRASGRLHPGPGTRPPQHPVNSRQLGQHTRPGRPGPGSDHPVRGPGGRLYPGPGPGPPRYPCRPRHPSRPARPGRSAPGRDRSVHDAGGRLYPGPGPGPPQHPGHPRRPGRPAWHRRPGPGRDHPVHRPAG